MNHTPRSAIVKKNCKLFKTNPNAQEALSADSVFPLSLRDTATYTKPIRRPYGYIYLIRNMITGQIYIGQTCGSIKDRWQTHKERKSHCVRLARAIQKYGSGAFMVMELYSGTSKKNLNNLESKAIVAYNSTDPEIGYNIMHGQEFPRHIAEKISLTQSQRALMRNPSCITSNDMCLCGHQRYYHFQYENACRKCFHCKQMRIQESESLACLRKMQEKEGMRLREEHISKGGKQFWD